METEIERLIYAGEDNNYITGLLGCGYPEVHAVRTRLGVENPEPTRFGVLLPYGGGGPGVDWGEVNRRIHEEE